jgi:hypothetical protein
MHNPYTANMKRFLAESIDTLHYVIIQPVLIPGNKMNRKSNLVPSSNIFVGNY